MTTNLIDNKMFDILLKYIRRHTSAKIAESDCALIKSAFTLKRIRKRQFLLQEGEVCRHFAFIVKGAMRQYVIDKKGAGHIVQLGIENCWMGDRESWVLAAPSAYCIDAWEHTDLLLISRSDTLQLALQCPCFNEMLRVLDDLNNIANQKRITSAISFTADIRYADFINRHPDLLVRFPQHLIASYLGIAKDTLSRISKQVTKNSCLMNNDNCLLV